MAVLHRVEMNVIHVGGVILVVANRVFPIPALPDTGFALADQGGAPSFRRRDRSREQGLDRPPPNREVEVVWRRHPLNRGRRAVGT